MSLFINDSIYIAQSRIRQEPVKKSGRIATASLSKDELFALNQILAQNYPPKLTALPRALIQRKLRPGTLNKLDDIASKLEWVVKK